MPKTRKECSDKWDALRKYAWFQEEKLGLTLEEQSEAVGHKGPCAVGVSHIAPGSQASFHDGLKVGDCVVAVGSKSVLGLPLSVVVSFIGSSPRPLKLTFLDKSVAKEYLRWTVEEDKLLVASHETHFPNWVAIGQCLPERPLYTHFKDRCVKNNLPISGLEKYYFNTSSQKKKEEKKEDGCNGSEPGWHAMVRGGRQAVDCCCCSKQWILDGWLSCNTRAYLSGVSCPIELFKKKR
jgi:hypothetical protein